MSTATVEQLPVDTAKTQGDDGFPALFRALATALGMDPDASNHLKKPDVNFLTEVASLPVNFAGMPAGTDVEGMRKWINDVFLEGDLPKHRAKFSFPYQHPVQKVKKEIITIDAPGGDDHFDLWIYETETRTSSSRPAILMFHGGGWIHGNPGGDENIAEIFASELNAVVIGVDYRLAPENLFPKPLDDCEEAVNWVERNATKYGIDPKKIALWGASAGGNLAAALALRVPQRLCFVSLVVPVTAHPKAVNAFADRRSFPKGKNELLFEEEVPTEAAVHEFESLYELYTGKPADPCDPFLSPIMAQPTADFPPTDVTVAACDSLRAQGQAFAELLRHSGVTVTEDVLPGVPHMFTLPTNAHVTVAWLKRQVDVLGKALSS